VNKSVFTSAANQALLGRTVPHVVGDVFQLGPMELDPAQLAYYLAENVRFNPDIHAAKEGGNPIDPETITAAGGPVVILEQNPSLPVLFDCGGLTYPESDFATGDETVYPMSTTDSTNPDDFTLFETGAVVSYLAGNVLQVEVDATTGAASTGFVPLTVAAHRPSGLYASWSTLTQGSGSTSASAALTAGAQPCRRPGAGA